VGVTPSSFCSQFLVSQVGLTWHADHSVRGTQVQLWVRIDINSFCFYSIDIRWEGWGLTTTNLREFWWDRSVNSYPSSWRHIMFACHWISEGENFGGELNSWCPNMRSSLPALFCSFRVLSPWSKHYMLYLSRGKSNSKSFFLKKRLQYLIFGEEILNTWNLFQKEYFCRYYQSNFGTLLENPLIRGSV
jgi:hypothetical protein